MTFRLYLGVKTIWYLHIHLGQFTRNYTQTVKRTADNKIKAEHQAQESARCSACFVVRGFQRGLPLGTRLCEAKCSVLYALSALPFQMPLPPGRARAFEAAGKQGCACRGECRKRRAGFISRQGVYESLRPSYPLRLVDKMSRSVATLPEK